MKSKIYLFLFSLCFSQNLPAQIFDFGNFNYGNFNSMIMEDWDNGNWKKTFRMTNTFDGNGNVTKVTMDSMNYVTNVWGNSIIISHTLNSNSTINYSLTQMWNPDESKWEDLQKMIYTYDGSKNILTQKMQMFFGTDWMDYLLTTNTYNSSGQLTKEVVQMLDFFTMQMKNSSQTTYTYNPDGTENQSIYQNWNAITSVWENSERFTNTYNAAKQTTSVLTEDYTTGAWVNYYKTTITYNTNGSVNEVLEQNWDISGGIWKDSGKEIYTYNNTNGSLKELLTMEWLPEQSKWENQSRITMTFSTTSILQPEMASTSQLRVYPNPFKDVISIEYNSLKESSIQLYNANGQLIRNFEKGEPLSKINLATCKNGMYLLKVISPESTKVVKLVKTN